MGCYPLLCINCWSWRRHIQIFYFESGLICSLIKRCLSLWLKILTYGIHNFNLIVRSIVRGLNRLILIPSRGLCADWPRTNLLWIFSVGLINCAHVVVVQHGGCWVDTWVFLARIRVVREARDIQARASKPRRRISIYHRGCHICQPTGPIYDHALISFLDVAGYVKMPLHVGSREHDRVSPLRLWLEWGPCIRLTCLWYNRSISILYFCLLHYIIQFPLLLKFLHYLESFLHTLNDSILLLYNISRRRIDLPVLQVIKILRLLLQFYLVYHLLSLALRVCGATMHYRLRFVIELIIQTLMAHINYF